MVSIFSLKHILLIVLIIIQSITISAQVTVGSGFAPAEGAILDIKAQMPDGDNVTSKKGGLLLSRVDLATKTSLYPFISDTTAANLNYPKDKTLHTGLLVFNIKADTNHNLEVGVYEWNGSLWRLINIDETNYLSAWYEVTTGNPAKDNNKNIYLSAKAAIKTSTIAKINNKKEATLTVAGGDISVNGITIGKGKANSNANMAIGVESLNSNTSGNNNTAIGYNSLEISSTATQNTSIGHMALSGLTTGNDNTVIGSDAGTTLTSGSNNIAIGTEAQLRTGNNDFQLNIGNTIFGTSSLDATNLGKISIGTNVAPTSNLHIEGDLILDLSNKTPIIDGEALLINSAGRMGIGALLPTPTPHTFYQSENSHSLVQAQVTSFNNASGFTIPWVETADKLSNSMTTFIPNENSFKANGNYKCQVSGYVGFQFLSAALAPTATTYAQMTNTDSGLAVAVLEIQMANEGSSTWTTVASGYQVYYGAAITSTVKVIQVPSTIIAVTENSRIRMILKKASVNTGVNIAVNAGYNSITKPGGARYSKGLTMVALQK